MKNKIITGTFFVFVFTAIFFTTGMYNDMKLDVHSLSISYVYKNSTLETFVYGESEIDSLNNEIDTVETANPGEVLNTDVVQSATLFEQQPTNNDTVDEIIEDVNPLVQGYIVTIDGVDMYTTDIAYFNEAIDLIYKSLLPTDDLYSKYLATGTVPTYTIDGKTYTDIVIDSSISIQEGFIPAEYALESTDEVYFYLLHGNTDKQVEAISPSNSTKSIQNQYELSDQTMKLNNQGLDNSSLYYDGQEIIVNQLNPHIRFATYYEENVTESIPFHTQEQPNSDMPEGDTNVLQNGVDGEKQVTYKTKVVNNQIDSTVAVKSEVTKRSEDYIVEVGTKTPDPEPEVAAPKSASGKLQVPSSGGIICGWYCYEGHAALDYQAWYGAPIYAADSGYVTVAGPYGGGAGNAVIIDHGNGMTTEYMHMSSVATSSGAYVTKGQVIGYEGSTGSVTTEHLHFVVKVNGVKVNPMNYY